MGLRPNFTKRQISNQIKAAVDQFRQAATDRFKYAGEEFVNLARQVDSYKDDTGNLRSSIWYSVLYNGKPIAQSFAGNQAEGRRQAKKAAKEIAKEYPKGFVLVGGAGMDYAASVEARGYDVVSTSAETAGRLLKAAIRNLKKRYNV